MFENIYKFFNENVLIEEANEESLKMIKLGSDMYREAQKSLRDAKYSSSYDFINNDLDMNAHERSIRRKVFTYLSISQKSDLNAALILVATVHDLERIGDYAKNIYQLSRKVDSRLDFKDYETKVQLIEDTIKRVFDGYDELFSDLDSEDIRKLTDQLTESIHSNEEIINEIIDRGEEAPFNKKDMALCIIYLRFLKRISSHLRNIATAYVNPFDRIGFSE